jgi:tRNA threonylcarbamoyladenosine biosynthesis protein TsaB
MKILGIDTSTGTLCLGACEADKVYEYDLQLNTRLSALLVPTVKRVTESLGWKISDIDYFAVGVGPGSFTGTRVGLATVKALSWSLNKPVAGISSLDILAQNAGKDRAFIIPVVDAKRDLVYASIYENQGASTKRIAPYMLLSCRELISKIRKNIPAKVLKDSVILGDGLNICSGYCSSGLSGVRILDKDYWRLEGRNIIKLAKIAVKGKKLTDAFRLEPLYLYPKECQIRQHKT